MSERLSKDELCRLRQEADGTIDRAESWRVTLKGALAHIAALDAETEQLSGDRYDAACEVTRLRGELSAAIKTADGVVIRPANDYWWRDGTRISVFRVGRNYAVIDPPLFSGADHVALSGVYSTREAAEAAKEASDDH